MEVEVLFSKWREEKRSQTTLLSGENLDGRRPEEIDLKA